MFYKEFFLLIVPNSFSCWSQHITFMISFVATFKMKIGPKYVVKIEACFNTCVHISAYLYVYFFQKTILSGQVTQIVCMPIYNFRDPHYRIKHQLNFQSYKKLMPFQPLGWRTGNATGFYFWTCFTQFWRPHYNSSKHLEFRFPWLQVHGPILSKWPSKHSVNISAEKGQMTMFLYIKFCFSDYKIRTQG